MTVVISQSVSIVDLGDLADSMQRYQVRVVLSPKEGEPVVTFISKWTDALEATAIWREHSSRTLDQVDDIDWRRMVKFPA